MRSKTTHATTRGATPGAGATNVSPGTVVLLQEVAKDAQRLLAAPTPHRESVARNILAKRLALLDRVQGARAIVAATGKS